MTQRIVLLLTPLCIGLFAGAFRATWVEPGSDFVRMLGLGMKFAALTGILSVACGVPAWWLIRRAGLRSAWQVTLIGAVLGGTCGALLPVVLGAAQAQQFLSGLYPASVEYAMFGALTAFIAWWFVLRPSERDVDAPGPTRG